MRTFLIRFLLASLVTWIAPTLVPNIETDGSIATILLMGAFLALGEIILVVIRMAAAFILFFLPNVVRVVLLRAASVVVCAGLVSGFAFSAPAWIGVAGFTILLSMTFLLPFAS